jgi:hypothetical protein
MESCRVYMLIIHTAAAAMEQMHVAAEQAKAAEEQKKAQEMEVGSMSHDGL